MQQTPELYTVAEFCKAVRISKRQYYRLRAAGEGPRVTTLGGVHVIKEIERQRWLSEHTERTAIDIH